MTARSPRRRWLALLSGGFGLAMTAQINFLVPLRARELGASFEVIGLIVGAGALAAAVSSLPLGSLIDRLGPRRAFIIGTGGAALLATAYLLVTSHLWLLAVQPLMGVVRNLGWVASQGYITSLGTAEERAGLTGRFTFFTNGGQMLAPMLIGGVAQLIGFRWSFGFLAAYAALFCVVGLLLAETRQPGDAKARAKQGTGLRSATELLAIRGIQAALLLTFARIWVTWVYITFLPVYLVDSGLEPGVVGTVMATSGLMAMMTGPTAATWTRRFQPHTVAFIGLLCGATGLVLAPHAAFMPVVYAVPALIGMGQGLSLPMLLAIVTSAAPDDRRGVALGLRSTVNQFAAAAAPVVIGPLIAALGILLGFTAGGLVAAGMLVGSRLLHVADRRATPA